jgi:hypothetical protein
MIFEVNLLQYLVILLIPSHFLIFIRHFVIFISNFITVLSHFTIVINHFSTEMLLLLLGCRGWPKESSVIA